ncbi:MAG: hypothetical protein KAX84_14840 [Burkholderiales bacterium]|nr:hypothetical protein [Burkholderiales bacterium]
MHRIFVDVGNLRQDAARGGIRRRRGRRIRRRCHGRLRAIVARPIRPGTGCNRKPKECNHVAPTLLHHAVLS